MLRSRYFGLGSVVFLLACSPTQELAASSGEMPVEPGNGVGGLADQLPSQEQHLNDSSAGQYSDTTQPNMASPDEQDMGAPPGLPVTEEQLGIDDYRTEGRVLLDADFEGQATGPYTEAQVVEDFSNAPPWNDGLDEGRAQVVRLEKTQVLRVDYPGQEFGASAAGVQFKVPFGQSYEELYLAYRVRFSEGFEWVKGGKLPGLVGGSAPTGCNNDEDGFSARMMWRAQGAAVQYVYFPEKESNCGDDFPYALKDAPAQFQTNTWHRVQHHLKMNTPGESDGVLEAWFDGELAYQTQELLYRRANASFAIDTLYFSTFYGGGDSSWAPDAPTFVEFDNFIVATEPIELPQRD
ncbi:MAG: hypothetical protein MK135_06775 [Polyangiaceae bacterium]|nr:hypothetical protein [Polyangiaceae bacterium]